MRLNRIAHLQTAKNTTKSMPFMKYLPSLCFLLLLCQVAFSQKTWYVDDKATGKGDGSTWADAFPKLQDALRKAQHGDRVQVAGGLYKPDNHRDSCFMLKNGVKLLGRYCPGGAANCDVATRETILSGDIGRLNDSTDNCYNVVRGVGTLDDDTYFGGFTVEKGFANGTAADPLYRRCGGGLFLHTTTFNNMSNGYLSFAQNYATHRGGQMYMNLTEGSTCLLGAGAAIYFSKGTSGLYVETRQAAPLVACGFLNNWLANTSTPDSALVYIMATNPNAKLQVAVGEVAQNKVAGYLCKIQSEGNVQMTVSASDNWVSKSGIQVVSNGEVSVRGIIRSMYGYTGNVMDIKAPFIRLAWSEIWLNASSSTGNGLRLENTGTLPFKRIVIENSRFPITRKPVLLISDDVSIDSSYIDILGPSGYFLQKGIGASLVSFTTTSSYICDFNEPPASYAPIFQTVFDHLPARFNCSFRKTVFSGLGRRIFDMPVFNNVIGATATSLSSVVRSEWLYCTFSNNFNNGLIPPPMHPFRFTGQVVGNTGQIRIAQATFNSCLFDYPSSVPLFDVADASYVDFRYNLTSHACTALASTGRISCQSSNFFNTRPSYLPRVPGQSRTAFDALLLSPCFLGINKGDKTIAGNIEGKKNPQNGAPDIGALETTVKVEAPEQISLCAGQPVDSLFKGNACRPYTYRWSGGGSTGTGLENMVSNGRYSLTITDAVGVPHLDTVNVQLNSKLDFTVTINANNASFTRTVGGTPPYTYRWSDGSTATSRTGLSIGTYSVTITDAKGCSLVVGVPITTVAANEQSSGRFSVQVLPNPSSVNAPARLEVRNGVLAHCQIYDLTGRIILQKVVNEAATALPLPTDIAKGIYKIRAMDRQGQVVVVSWVVE